MEVLALRNVAASLGVFSRVSKPAQVASTPAVAFSLKHPGFSSVSEWTKGQSNRADEYIYIYIYIFFFECACAELAPMFMVNVFNDRRATTFLLQDGLERSVSQSQTVMEFHEYCFQCCYQVAVC